MPDHFDIELLLQLLAVDSPSGDEHLMADWLTNWVAGNVDDANIVRLRDCLVVTKGEKPPVALFAHIDTVGFTLGHGAEMIEIGSPRVDPGMKVRSIEDKDEDHVGTVKGTANWRLSGLNVAPGSRLVSADTVMVAEGWIQSPCLDNRGGVWATLQALQRCDRIAAAFTTGEEVGGGGAAICARHLWDSYGTKSAFVADITWDTEQVHCGDGVALSWRDQTIPSQRFVKEIVELAKSSGIAHQIEIESAGASDGIGIERSGCPIDWMFIGAPEQHPHSSHERIFLTDLQAMADMLVYLTDRKSAAR